MSSKAAKFLSPPPPLSPSDMTPPPSTQVPPARRSRSQSGSHLATPPDLEKSLCVAYGASENLPTVEDVDGADESQLRAITKDLLTVTQQARMSALHFKLQNSLLSFASNEAVKRAEVEQHLAKREVEIRQSDEYQKRHFPSPPPQLPQSDYLRDQLEVQLDGALRHGRKIEEVNRTLDRRLHRAKIVIEEERERSGLLKEEVGLLKKRIRDNREHFSHMLENNLLSPVSQPDYQTPKRRSAAPRRDPSPVSSGQNKDGSHSAFAALLAAGRVLNNRESASVEPTPHYATQRQARHPAMSSFPMTPARSSRYGSTHQDERRRGLSSSIERDRYDRDSTISASEDEDYVAGPLPRQQPPASAPAKSSSLVQTRLLGSVNKAGVESSPSKLKRKASFENVSATKKSKDSGSAGLGISLGNT